MAFSNFLTVSDKINDDLNQPAKANEVERVECRCCGMSEDCTPTYIRRIREFHCGNWICGLCAEAVKEKKKRAPSMAMEEALESHMALCRQFNRTVRLNPELSLVGAMRDIARKSFQYRASHGSYAPKIARSSSCGPKAKAEIGSSSIQ
ncbi:uncharacterized protein LOC103718745 [Phoenix dactylifera]|uniref:Uncharacterized protein LOC103718745 n=1 Tax=Phoenix dactylifera TaxID=42345 RepID=A0A8B7CT65_PHODC|nr:uncharacterized protein LOC103718745 [Phoenix dactylifera]